MAPPIKPPMTATATRSFAVKKGITRVGFKLAIYGQEGIGKSTLASMCPDAEFADIEDSMQDLDVARVQGISCWSDLRAWVQSLGAGKVGGIDSITRAEDWAAEHIIKTKVANDGTRAKDSLEDFKYKAGLQYLVDEFKKLLSDIDAARQRGASFIFVAHSRINRVKNPDGSDFLRTEPRLLDDPKGSNMLTFVQFCDHVAFIGLDINVERAKASGKGSRTIYMDTSPTRISKCRGISDEQIPFTIPDGGRIFWDLFNK
jgi:hypothetical protein